MRSFILAGNGGSTGEFQLAIGFKSMDLPLRITDPAGDGQTAENRHSTRTEPESPSEVLASARSKRVLIQTFRPLAESLDWQLGQLYWKERGSQAFIRGEVPYVINNDGSLSEAAAEIFFASLQAAEAAGRLERRIFALELGIGIGLFARYFLDRFRELCHQRAKDYYERFCYMAADSSERMLDDIARHRLLSHHEGHYRLVLADASRPDFVSAQISGECGPGAVRAVFLNYVLDSLPAAVLKRDGGAVSQLCLQTYLARGLKLEDHTALDEEEIARCAASSDPAEMGRLVDLYHIFNVEPVYLPVDSESIPYADFAASQLTGDGDSLLHNHGALQCAENLLNFLSEGAFLMISDYGQTKPAPAAEENLHQHFSASTAISLNFSLLKSYFSELKRFDWVEPAEDNGHIHTRLIGRKFAGETVNRFHEHISKKLFDWVTQPLEAARAYLRQGRCEAALDAYREALDRQPRNWVLLGEIAEFLILNLRDYSGGVELARQALSLNTLDPASWNTLGDGLFYLERSDEAHQAFLQALTLHQQDIRARYNLIYTYARKNDYAMALRMVAEGLAYDRTGEYTQRLLEKQSEILRQITAQRQERTRLLADRIAGFTAGHAPLETAGGRDAAQSIKNEKMQERAWNMTTKFADGGGSYDGPARA
jgi:tetratricopeptide (TPR) repeat protein